MWCVYVLKSNKKNWYYVGSSDSLSRRLSEHNAGKVLSTKGYAPLRVIFQKEFKTEKEARKYEQKIKHQRILKESIIKRLGV